MHILAGRHKGTQLKSLDGVHTRPTRGRVAESIFNILAHNQFLDHPFLFQQQDVLDLFAGSGRLGLEALSRGAVSVCFVEHDKDAYKIIQENVKKCHQQANSSILLSDATVFNLSGSVQKFSLVFCDAPYRQKLSENALSNILSKNYLKDQAIICIETEKNYDLPIYDSLLLLDRRHYGETCIHFLKYHII